MESAFDLLGYDTETTSPTPATTRVVQAAAILRKPDGSKTTVVNQLCNPGCSISDGAREVHGISDEMVEDKESDTVVMGKLHAYVKENRTKIIVIGHNIVGFDLPILFRVGGDGEKIDVLYIDTFVAAIRIFPDAHSHKLGELYEWFGFGAPTGAHEAEADIEMVFNIADYMRTGLKMSWEEMARWTMKARALKRCHFGKHKGKLWGKPVPGDNLTPQHFVPWPYVKHVICDKFDPTPDLVETMRVKYGLRFKKRSLL